MSTGSLLIGFSLAVVVIAYVARPFRPSAGKSSRDQVIENWVAEVRAEKTAVGKEITVEKPPAAANEPVNFCAQCGRRVGPDDRFCPGCGTPLQGGKP